MAVFAMLRTMHARAKQFAVFLHADIDAVSTALRGFYLKWFLRFAFGDMRRGSSPRDAKT